MYYVLTIDLDRLNVINNFWGITSFILHFKHIND